MKCEPFVPLWQERSAVSLCVRCCIGMLLLCVDMTALPDFGACRFPLEDTLQANVSPYLRVQRSCRSSLSGVYELQGWSLLGRPWYKCENIITSSVVYLWYDEHCGEAWYLKSTAPGDGADSCAFYSKLGRTSCQTFLSGMWSATKTKQNLQADHTRMSVP